jgi:hypothetical protein
VGRISFVAWLFVSALACLLLAAIESSLGWLIGGIILVLVAVFAHRLLKRERDVGRQGPSLRFAGLAMLAMLIVMGLLFWLQFSA